MSHTPDGRILDKPPKPKPGELLLPSDFELKFWIFGAIAIVLYAGQAFVASLSETAIQVSTCATVLMLIAFWVECLRLLHRTVRLLPAHRRPANPTALIVLLLIPVLNALVRLWALPVVALRVSQDCRDKEVEQQPFLVPLAVVAAVVGLGGALTLHRDFAAREPVLAGVLSVLSIGAHLWFFVVLQRAARALAVYRHDRANAAGVAETFE